MPDPRVPLILSAQGLTLKDILSDGTRDRVAREENVTYVIHVSMSVFINISQAYWAKPDHMYISYTSYKMYSTRREKTDFVGVTRVDNLNQGL